MNRTGIVGMERFLQRFLGTAGVEVVYATDAATDQHAELVVEHGASLCSRDAHFGKLAQLDVV